MERLIETRRIIAVAAASFILMASGCEQEEQTGTDNDSSITEPSLSEQVDASLNRLLAYTNCIGRAAATEDCDQDGVANIADLIPLKDDNADDDGDLVLNRLDKWPLLDDKTMDIDRDGTADYLDTFFGDNYQDADGDGWINGLDPQPYAAPPLTHVLPQPPQSLTNNDLANLLLEQQMRQKFLAQIYGPKPDDDFDGTPNEIDTTPNEYTNDGDGDHEPDFYDPEPHDPTLDSQNDPYDPTNDEYWEDDSDNYWESE